MTSLARLPPPPPPKPKGYQLPSAPTYSQKLAEFGLPPQDSDTDSGICADSEQASPRHSNSPSGHSASPQLNAHAQLAAHAHSSAAARARSTASPTRSYASYPHQINNPYHSQLLDDHRDYLTPNSARRLILPPDSSYSPRKLPARPHNGQIPRKQQFRVRFADEVDSGASTSSSASEQSSTSPRNPEPVTDRPYPSFTKPLLNNNQPNFSPKYESHFARKFDSLQREQRQNERERERSRPTRAPPGPASYSIDDVESLPEPPSYAIALQRLRNMDSPRESVRDTVIRQNVQDTLSRQFRNRSASLPRGTRRLDTADLYSMERPLYDYQMNTLMNENQQQQQLLGSLDNLRINTEGDYEDTLTRRRRLPVAPLMNAASRISSEGAENERRGSLMSSRRLRNRMAPGLAQTQRSASVGRYPSMERLGYEYRTPEIPSVRAQLVALDQRGFRSVLIEKTQPGPFGFYIATGVMNGQRGIFISRVSLPSLSPMLSVGDEILYVDDELVKGRSLEYVQSLIAGKTSVVIVLLPTVGPALC